MKALIRAGLALALTPLGGCASFLNDWDILTSSAVSPTQVVVAGNSFDALEATATNYLKLPPCVNGGTPVCRTQAAVNVIVPAIRAGRTARNQLEAYVNSNPGQPVSVSLYNVLTTAITALQGAFTQYNVPST